MDSHVTSSGLWNVIVMMSLLVCVVIGLCLWYILIFFSKKTSTRSGGKKNRGSGKSTEEQNLIGHMIDEDFLVDNEEEPDAMDIKDEPIKGAGTKNEIKF